MQARTGSRTQPAASHAFDLRIVAFAASPRALRGLCELFAVDPGTAQRVIANLPAVVRRGVPAAEAQRLAAALTDLGAKVQLDPVPGSGTDAPRPPPPPPPKAAVPRRAPANDAPPGLHVDSAELEFDVLSAFDAAMDTGEVPPDELPLPMPAPEPEPDLFATSPDAGALRQGRRADLVLGDGASAKELDIDVAHASPARARAEAPAAPTRDRRTNPGLPAVKSAELAAPPGPAPLTRAAVIRHEAPVQRARWLPLLQLLGGVGVCVGCYWFDSSILFGNAALPSVIAQGLALQQLVLGARGLLR